MATAAIAMETETGITTQAFITVRLADTMDMSMLILGFRTIVTRTRTIQQLHPPGTITT